MASSLLNDVGIEFESHAVANQLQVWGLHETAAMEVGSTVWLPTALINVQNPKKTTRVHLSLVCPLLFETQRVGQITVQLMVGNGGFELP